MYFDQFGNVRACCQNTDVLMGNVTEQSIAEIWHGARTRALRGALARGDLSQGCGFCQWQVDQGDDAIVFARTFDDLPVLEEHPRWPVQMEFSMTNSCNLQCVMCNGDWSSSIRAHREHRPPLPEAYGDAFFDELEQFLPNLRKANFLGGEPFLGKEPLRVMEMLADLPTPPSVAVTTNGTQWSPRIEALCERLPISFVVSLDGITEDTYESIRIGADFDQVMANIERFRTYAARNGTQVSLAHCLMRPNWREFAHLLRFAEDRQMTVGINEVLFPLELSLFQASADELRQVVRTMEADTDGTAASLDRLRPVWDGQVDALRHRLQELDRGEQVHVRPWAGPSDQGENWSALATRLLAEWVIDVAPTTLILQEGRAATIEGAMAYYLSTLDLEAASTPAEVLDVLGRAIGDDVVQQRPASSLVEDVVLADATGRSALSFRAAWSTVEAVTTLLLAVRNPPDLPSDPFAVLSEWAAPGTVTVLACSDDERVTEVQGDVGVLGLEADSQLVGRSADELFALLDARSGPVEVHPGPSGFSADSLVTLSGAQRAGRGRLRVMVERSGGSVRVLLAPEPWA